MFFVSFSITTWASQSLTYRYLVKHELTFVLLTGLGDLPRLSLRVKLLARPLLLGLRLASRGETVRRGREADRDSRLSNDRSEYGERLCGLPLESERDRDREGILLFSVLKSGKWQCKSQVFMVRPRAG